jgi:hypothetical protein
MMRELEKKLKYIKRSNEVNEVEDKRNVERKTERVE